MLAELLDRLDAVVSELAATDVTPLSDEELLDVLRRLEVVKRRLAPVDHAVLNSADSRGLHSTLKCASLPALLSELLRIDRSEANARVRAAENFGTRTVWSGGLIGPRFPDTAAALADGAISSAHAAVVARAVDALPDAVVDEHGDFVEKSLLELCHDETPYDVAKVARHMVDLLDQDGTLREERDRERRRDLQLQRRPDGSAKLVGELTAECAEALQTALDALAAPKPAAAGAENADSETGESRGGGATAGERIRDERTAGQCNHDVLMALAYASTRAQVLPNAGGVACTVLLTMDADAWVTGQGVARTGHGYTVSAQQAEKWAADGADARFLLVLLDKTKAIAAYSSIHRIYTEQQRLAIIARDGCCTMPGCHAPPAYCHIDHVNDWAATRRTSVDDGQLLCTFEHRNRKNQGWTPAMVDGRPTWTEPAWRRRLR